MSLLTLLLLVLVIAFLFGGYGHRAGWGPYGWSPVGIVLVIVLVLALSGRLHVW